MILIHFDVEPQKIHHNFRCFYFILFFIYFPYYILRIILTLTKFQITLYGFWSTKGFCEYSFEARNDRFDQNDKI